MNIKTFSENSFCGKNFILQISIKHKIYKITNELRLLVLLRSVELRDQNGIAHNIKVQTLGTEDTWKTPSLLLLCTENGGKMIFSQVCARESLFN